MLYSETTAPPTSTLLSCIAYPAFLKSQIRAANLKHPNRRRASIGVNREPCFNASRIAAVCVMLYSPAGGPGMLQSSC